MASIPQISALSTRSRPRSRPYVLNRAIEGGAGRDFFVRVLPDPELSPLQDAEVSSIEDSDVSLLPMPQQVEIDAWRSITGTATIQ